MTCDATLARIHQYVSQREYVHRYYANCSFYSSLLITFSIHVRHLLILGVSSTHIVCDSMTTR